MKKVNKLLVSLGVAGACLAAPLAQAQTTVSTIPVGFITLDFKPSDDGLKSKITLVGLGITTAVEFQGVATGISGTDLTVPGIVENQFAQAAYIEIASGEHEGLMVDIVSTAADTITLAQDISEMIDVDDSIRVRLHHTVSSVFGVNNEAGLLAQVPGSSAKFDTVNVFGTGGSVTSYSFLAGPDVWTDGASDATNAVLYPDQGIVVRRFGTDPASVKLLGTVKTGVASTTFETGFNVVANQFPVDTTLADFGLDTVEGESTGVRAGTNTGPGGADRLRIFDDNGVPTSYFLLDTGSGFIWTDGAGDASNVVIKAGTSFILDRQEVAGPINWFQGQTFSLQN